MSSTSMAPDLAVYFQAVTPHATNELRLYERIASTLKNLRYEDAASRTSTAVALSGIEAQLAPLATAVMSVRPPARLSVAHEAQVKAIQQMASATRELASAFRGDAAARRTRVEAAREQAAAAEGSTRSGASSITAALGVAAAALATVPIVGQIIAAILAVVAAIIVLIGQILSKVKEDEAEAQKKDDDDRP